MQKGFTSIYVLVSVLIIILIIIATSFNRYENNNQENIVSATTIPTPQIFPYSKPELDKHDSYRIILVGDSMTESLGINANPLRLALQQYYPDTEFVTYNYSVPSANILTVEQRLTEGMTYLGQSQPPILRQGFDILIIESFAYNPLSELSLEEGLQKQEEVFASVISTLIKNRPESVIMMMNMIAPDNLTFAQASRDLSQEVRTQWISERVAYMDNAKDFAETNNIPFIDIYTDSLNIEGNVIEGYISSDNIHPSQIGTDFIAETIAEYIYTNNIIPRPQE